jgi:hypothetical protein
VNPHQIGELLLPARRRFLGNAGLGFGGMALAALLGDESRGGTTRRGRGVSSGCS